MNQSLLPSSDNLAATLPVRGDPDAVFAPLFARIEEGTISREQNRILPFEQVGWLREAGFGALRIPRDLGGYGLGTAEAFALLADLAAADPNVAHLFRGHFAVIEERIAQAPGPVREKWLRRFGQGDIVGNASTETGEGAGIARKSTEIIRGLNGEVTLSGRKFYTTGSLFADWIDTSATLTHADGREEIASVLVNARHPGVRIEDDWDGFGQKLTGTGTGHFDAVPIEEEDILTRSARLPSLGAVYQSVLLAVVTGIARKAVAETTALLQGRERVYSHGNSALARHDPQLLQVVGEIAARAHAVEILFRDQAAALAPVSALWRSADPETLRAAAAALEVRTGQTQLVIADLVLDLTTRLFNALGASAARQGHALDRHWRNARVVLSHNPLVYRARVAGDYLVNERQPDLAWSVGISSGAELQGASHG